MKKDETHKKVISLLMKIKNKENIILKNFLYEDDLFFIDYKKEKNACIIANIYGDEIYTSYVLLTYINMMMGSDYNIHAIPFLNYKKNIFEQNIIDNIVSYIDKNNIQLYVCIGQSAKHFDGFYILRPSTIKINRSKNLTSFLKDKSYVLGKYSLRTDMPTYSIIRTNEKILNIISEYADEAYVFKITPNDITSGILSLAFILNDKVLLEYPKYMLYNADL